MLRALAAFAVLAAVALGVPYGEIWWKCRAPASEACVWAKAFLPLTLGVCAGLGIIAALLVWFALGRRPRQ